MQLDCGSQKEASLYLSHKKLFQDYQNQGGDTLKTRFLLHSIPVLLFHRIARRDSAAQLRDCAQGPLF